MGISGFMQWFVATFGPAVSTISNPMPKSQGQRPAPSQQQFTCDYLYLDLNGFIHSKSRQARDEAHLVFRIFSQIDLIMRLCRPRKAVYLCVDGPASLAKLAEQRKRRLDKANKVDRDTAANKKKKGNFDSLQLTPGTDFMKRLKDALCHLVCERLANGNRYRDVKFVISAADVAGEGELKIIEFLRQHEADTNATHIVAGSDSDLLVQTVLLDRVRVHVLDLQSQRLIDVPRLKTLFRSMFPKVPDRSIAFDFVVIALLQGNDYLPKWRGVNLSSMWTQYVVQRNKGGPPLYRIEERAVDVRALYSLLQASAKHVPRGAVPLTLERVQLQLHIEDLRAPITFEPEPSSPQESLSPLNMQKEDLADESIIDDGKDKDDELLDSKAIGDAESESESGMENGDEDDEEKDDPSMDPAEIAAAWEAYDGLAHCKHHIEGIAWCIESYRRGDCVDQSWCYLYQVAPSVFTLSKWVNAAPGASTPPLLVSFVPRDDDFVEGLPLPPLAFGLSLLPPQGAHHLPLPLQGLLSLNGTLREIFAHKRLHPEDLIDLTSRALSAACELLSEEDKALIVSKARFGTIETFELSRQEQHDFRPPPFHWRSEKKDKRQSSLGPPYYIKTRSHSSIASVIALISSRASHEAGTSRPTQNRVPPYIQSNTPVQSIPRSIPVSPPVPQPRISPQPALVEVPMKPTMTSPKEEEEGWVRSSAHRRAKLKNRSDPSYWIPKPKPRLDESGQELTDWSWIDATTSQQQPYSHYHQPSSLNTSSISYQHVTYRDLHSRTGGNGSQRGNRGERRSRGQVQDHSQLVSGTDTKQVIQSYEQLELTWQQMNGF